MFILLSQKRDRFKPVGHVFFVFFSSFFFSFFLEKPAITGLASDERPRDSRLTYGSAYVMLRPTYSIEFAGATGSHGVAITLLAHGWGFKKKKNINQLDRIFCDNLGNSPKERGR